MRRLFALLAAIGVLAAGPVRAFEVNSLGVNGHPFFKSLDLSGAGADGILVPSGSITGGYAASNYSTGNAYSFLNTYTGTGGAGGAATGILSRLDYKPPTGDNGNHAGLYGDLWMDAPYSFTGLPAGVKGNSYAIAQITATIATGGTNNAVGDALTVVGGTCNTQLNNQPQFIVDSVSGGAVTAVHFLGALGACTVYPGNPVTVTSSNGGATPPTLNLTVDTTPNMSTGLIGGYFRVRNQSAGTITNAYSVYADGAYNSANGAITNAYSVYMVQPYTTTNPVGASYGLYAAGAFANGTIAAANDVDITVVGSGTGSIKLTPGATGYTHIGVSASTAEASGSTNEAGIYAYMASDANAHIDAVAEGSASARLKLRAYDNGVYKGVQIEPDGGLLLGATTFNALLEGELGFIKTVAGTTAPGAAGGKLKMVCGTNAGSLKLIAFGGTSTTPVTVLDNIGSGATGC